MLLTFFTYCAWALALIAGFFLYPVLRLVTYSVLRLVTYSVLRLFVSLWANLRGTQ